MYFLASGRRVAHFLRAHSRKLWLAAGVFLLLAAAGGWGAVSFLRQPSESVPAEPASQEDSSVLTVPIIMYHGIREEEQNRYLVSKERFEEDLQYLRQQGYTTILLSELVEYAKDPSKAPEKPIMLTFDDGYWDNYLNAYPLLRKYGCKAVMSPIAKEAQEAESESQRNIRWSQCRWEELSDMCRSGLVELENHSYDLHSIQGGVQGAARIPGETEEAYRSRLTDDLKKANQLFQMHTGRTPQAFVYPYGAVSEGSRELLKELGFEAAMDCEEKINVIHSSEDLFSLHRFLRPPELSSAHFFERILKT